MSKFEDPIDFTKGFMSWAPAHSLTTRRWLDELYKRKGFYRLGEGGAKKVKSSSAGD